MYFETTMHATRDVESAQVAAQLVKDHEVCDYEALRWTAPGGRRLIVVADNHCNNPWLEVAVIDPDRNLQIESITAGWCDLEKLTAHFETCETTDFIFRRNIKLPLDGQNEDAKATFECGCCGTGFKSTYKEQRQYDQDNGYGFCPECVARYHS